ncbi:peptidase M50 [Prosthecochloris sp. ZM]|uniref:site-2 protease family protein n=1 Tax=unclassified Prosthecochloris TaxID=2632826 RepID=UPI000DF7B188|nr:MULTISPECIES: site-2 protease family protein [unclassified Prosthecochloris]NEX12966.1 site-2 protease family protein [Prosthecochloris sp.]RDD30973.1 peptidase M50 [Prosthecochloris sp. ZM]RDD31330.1 peptidase M50 [Prosthecochloris sp. ZM]
MRDNPSTRREILAEQNYLLHITLLCITLLTTLWAGAFWTGHQVRIDSLVNFFKDLSYGKEYAAALLIFLGVHEFGHFFAALSHRIRTTLPYFIPVPPMPFLLNLGTLGAVIRIKEKIPDTKSLFDTGVSGPLSGFIIALGLLIYGFTHLPPMDYIYAIHPEYRSLGGIPATAPAETLFLGKNLLYILLEEIIRPSQLPPMTEMYHYPFLFAGWLGCFVTALNLLPVGQLDGGHITYAMFGKKGHLLTARIFLFFIIVLGLPSFLFIITELILPQQGQLLAPWLIEWSWPGWILWAFILYKVIGVEHPATQIKQPLSTKRTLLGWIAIAIFILCFTPVPFGVI